MRYLSVCSGIEAVTAAWHSLNLEPAAFAEIDRFPSELLRHHYPGVPNHGDFTTIRGDEYGTVNLLVGGTPCQDFSVAGLRAGLDGKRGGLTIEFARLAHRLVARARTKWLVWENVPGVLSIDDGEAFAIFLSALSGRVVHVPGGGWQNSGVVEGTATTFGIAYRVLDAQFFGVPQRRRRVFVVGHLGDWRRAAAVLFERHSLSGYPPPRREAGQRVAPSLSQSLRSSGGIGMSDQELFSQKGGGLTWTGDCVASTGDTAHCLNAGGMGRQDYETETLVVGALACNAGPNGHDAGNFHCNQAVDAGYILPVTHSLRADGFDASGDGTGRGTPLIAAPLMSGSGHAAGHNARSGHCKDSHIVAVSANQRGEVRERSVHGSLNGSKSGKQFDGVMQGMAVRRLTPEECEALQGFPRGYTKITAKTADGPRYKALGNSMAVPVMRWLGERIQAVKSLP